MPFEAAAAAQTAPTVNFKRRAEVKQLLAVLWLALLALATPAAAQTFPQLTGRVVDQAHLLTPAQVAGPHQQVRGA